MNPGAILLISFRYLFARGPGKSLSLKRIRGGILGIALSLVPLVVVYQVANGMIGGISARYVETSTYHIRVDPPMDSLGRNIDPRVVAAVQAVPGVIWAGPELQGLALASSRHNSVSIQVRAVFPELVDEPGFHANMHIISGGFDLHDPQAVVIGQEIASALRVAVGDPLNLITVRGQGRGPLIPRVSHFRVTGIVTSGYQQLDGMWVFVNLDRGRQILAPSGSTEFLGVKVAHPNSLPNPLFADTAATAQSDGITEMVMAAAGTGWRAFTWFELERGKFLNFLTTRNILLFIMVLIVLVASVNVSSSMIMLVMEKQSEIAILKSIGARPGSIAWVFIIAGGVTGALGGLIGLAIGAMAAYRVNEIMQGIEWLINAGGALVWQVAQGLGGAPFQNITIFNPALYLDHIPIDIRASDLIWMGCLTVVLSMLASYFPARRAARLHPLQIFRRS